jgi:predicted ATPase
VKTAPGAADTPELVGGRYRVEDPIGRGAAGKVFRGVDGTTGGVVAIKVLDPSVASEAPGMLEHFRTEGTTLAGLRHPSIVRLVEVVEEAGRHCLVMEYVSGGSLKELLLRESRLPIRRAVEIGLDLADALACTHEAGVLHRDVKPSNILLADDGTPRLSDFGVASLSESATGRLGESGRQRRSMASGVKAEARRFSDSPTRPLEGGVVGRVGTLAYMSPEAFRGEELGPESDIWSLGMVLYEMVAGGLPFEDRGAGSWVVPLDERPVPSLAVARAEVPDGLAALVREMVERDRAERLSDARAVTARLEAILGDLEVLERGIGDRAGAPPEYATPFVGREQELAQLISWLRGPSGRLITLTGPGGIGKSRLAVEVVSRVSRGFTDGVWFVPLAGIDSIAHIALAIARALDFAFRGPKDPEEQLLDYLREKDLLLVLDSFEHLLEGIDLLERIVTTAQRVRLLVTSRERLKLPGEHRLDLGGVAVPGEGLGVPASCASVELFTALAKRSQPGFVLSEDDVPSVVRICTSVGGIPLAIEMAGAWVGTLSCAAIAEAVERNVDLLGGSRSDLPERHRTPRAVFDHSWSLLHHSEQRAFARMSVFRGGFAREAGMRVAGASQALLSALADKSLLRKDATGRYHVHELLRQYADEALRASTHSLCEVADLHAEYYTSLMEHRAAEMRRGDTAALTLIEGEIDNVRLACCRILERRRPGDIERMLGSLRPYYDAQCLFAEGEELSRRSAEALAPDPGAPADSRRTYAVALANRAGFLNRLGRGKEAVPPAREALVLLRDLGADRDAAFAANVLGIAYADVGDHASAERAFGEALALFEETDNLRGIGNVLGHLSQIAHENGEFDKERDLHERRLDVFRRAAYPRGVRDSLYGLGVLHLALSEAAEAHARFDEYLGLCREAWDRRGEAMALMNLAFAEAMLGCTNGVSERLQQSRKILCELGDGRGVGEVLATHGEVLRIWGDFAGAKELYREALVLADQTDWSWSKVIARACLAEITRLLGEYDASVEWHREAVECAIRFGIAVKLAEVLVSFAELVVIRRGDNQRALQAVLLALRVSERGASVKGDPHALARRFAAGLESAAVEAARAWAESRPPDELARRLVTGET